MVATKITEIIIQGIIGIYAICKAYNSAENNNVSFTIFYCTLWSLCLMSLL